jgi:hypothetical protein
VSVPATNTSSETSERLEANAREFDRGRPVLAEGEGEGEGEG